MTPRSPTRMFAGHCDRYGVTVASSVVRTDCAVADPFRKPLYPPGTNRCAPKQGLHIGTWARGPASRADLAVPSADAAALRGAPPHTTRPGGALRDLRRSNPHLRRLRSGVHPLGRRSGVLRQKGFASDPKRCTAAEPAGAPLATPATTSARSAARAATSAATTARPRVLRGASARRAATRPRCRSSRGWTARSTARTASGPSGRTDPRSVGAEGWPRDHEPDRRDAHGRSP